MKAAGWGRPLLPRLDAELQRGRCLPGVCGTAWDPRAGRGTADSPAERRAPPRYPRALSFAAKRSLMLLCSSTLHKFIHSIIFCSLSHHHLQSRSLLYFSKDQETKSEMGVHKCTKMLGNHTVIIESQ